MQRHTAETAARYSDRFIKPDAPTLFLPGMQSNSTTEKDPWKKERKNGGEKKEAAPGKEKKNTHKKPAYFQHELTAPFSLHRRTYPV